MFGPRVHELVTGTKMSEFVWTRPFPLPPPDTSNRPSGRKLCPLQNVISEIGRAVNRPVAGSHTCGIALVPPKLNTRPSINRCRWTCTIGAGSTADHWPTSAAVPPVVTVMLELPLCPSLVAVIVAEPAPAPVTRPVPDTVATPVALLSHVIARPVSGW